MSSIPRPAISRLCSMQFLKSARTSAPSLTISVPNSAPQRRRFSARLYRIEPESASELKYRLMLRYESTWVRGEAEEER